MRRITLLLCWVLMLAACRPGAQSGANSASTAEAGRCGAAELRHLVGQPHDAFDPGAREGPVRILPPNAMRTMDHRPERLNLSVDENRRITRIWCG